MRVAHRIALLGALVSLATGAAAQKPLPCLSQEEAEGVMMFALPSVITGLRAQCIKSLPATASLIQSGSLIAARYQVDADAAWPVAQKAFDKMSGLKASGLIGAEATRNLIEMAINEGLTQQIKPDECPLVDRMVDTLQPLPARNMAVLVSTLMLIGNKRNAQTGPFRICNAPRPASPSTASK